VEAHLNLKVLLTFHTYSELVLYPWGHTYDAISNAKDLATFDKFNRPTTVRSERDVDGDGDIDAADVIETTTAAYDNKGRVTASTDRVTDGTGVLLYFEKDTIAYGKNTQTETRDIDDDGDGVFDRHVETVLPLLQF